MEQLDWASILQGLGGGAGPSSLPLDVSQPTINPPPDFAGPGQVTAQPHDFNATQPVLPPVTPTGADVPPLPASSPAQGLESGRSAPLPGVAPGSPAGAGMRQGREGERDLDLGAALTGKPALGAGARGPISLGGPGGPTPLGSQGPITLGGPGGPTPFSGAAKTPADQAKQAAGIAAALKGVQAPAAPAVQKVSTPNAPRPTGTIKAGDLQALLMSLNAGGGGGQPATLGRSIGGR